MQTQLIERCITKYYLNLQKIKSFEMKIATGILVLLFIIVAYIYVSYRIWHILPFSNQLKTTLTVLYNFGTVAFFVFFIGSHLSGNVINYNFSKFLYEAGTSSLFVSLYLLFTFLVIDILRLVRILPKDFTDNNIVGTIGVTALMFIIFIGANINYNKKHRESISLTTNKPLKKPLKLVLLSDLHLGYHNERAEFAKWVDIINNEQPDLILLGGDLVDFNTVPLLEKNVAEEIQRLKAPIYACLGNHEYIGGEKNAANFYQLAGINLLQDKAVELPEYGLCIIGRDDRTHRRRKKIPAIIEGLKTDSLYTIVLDHQPFHLEESEQSNIDFQFSGHTHYGQVWPITYIIDNMYECGYGPWQRGNTHYYISSGMGIWGGKFRIGTQSEYLVAEIKN